MGCFFFMIFSLEAYMVHQRFPIEQEWEEENLTPFDELIISWNALRPVEGKFLFYVSVKINKWSPWLLYAAWGSQGQSSFISTTQIAPVRVYQNALEVVGGKKATAFKIKIIAEGCAALTNIQAVHVYTNGDRTRELQQPVSCSTSIYLPVSGLSQMSVNHPRHAALCSPVSTLAVIYYLSNNYAVDPRCFAQNIWDAGFDIFGNWVFNAAQASIHLGFGWDVWIERLDGFDNVCHYLTQGAPVVVSVRSPLPGGARYYAKGHLIDVIGYDALHQKVICMDPAFPTNSQTHVSYDLSDFTKAWSRRGNVAIVFSKRSVLQ
jgi:hypothetical protein